MQLNFFDNPWFPNVLELERKEDLKRRPDTYGHVWLADFLEYPEGSFFLREINKAKDEELQLANNLGFFSGSDSNPLIKKAKADHAVTVYKREGLEGRMKQLNIEINAAKKAEEAEKVALIEEVEGGK